MRCDVGVVAGGSDQTGLTQSLERVAQLRQPTLAGNRRARSRSACARSVPASGLRVGTDRQPPRRDGVTACDRNSAASCSSGAKPRHWRSKRQRLRELHLVIEFGKANHVTAAATAVAVEQALAGIHQKARFVIGVQRTQSHPSAAAELPGRLPIMRSADSPAAESAVSTRREPGDSRTSCLDAAEYGRARPDPRQGWWVPAESARLGTPAFTQHHRLQQSPLRPSAHGGWIGQA